MPQPQITYLLLGGNLGDVQGTFEQAIEAIDLHVGPITNHSSLYQTAAWGIEDQPDFLNQVVVCTTILSVDELLQACQHIEKQLGRVRHERWCERTIDIDILFYGKEIIHTTDITIPHPQIQHRRFTLAPLVELAPDFLHPQLNETMADLWRNTNDQLPVERLNQAIP